MSAKEIKAEIRAVRAEMKERGYLMARRLKERAKAVSDTWGSSSTQESLAAKLNDMGNNILIANQGR